MALDGSGSDAFGDSVAVWGDTVVVGTGFEDSNGVGMNPPSQADNSLSESGAAYVFTGLGPPVADAGPDQLVHIPSGGTADVALDGSGSSNLGGDPLIYTWTGAVPRRRRYRDERDGDGDATARSPHRDADRR